MGKIVSALKNDLTPALNNYSDKYIERKQDAAKAKMLELGCPSASINDNTGKRFMTVEEGAEWDIKNKEHLQKIENTS